MPEERRIVELEVNEVSLVDRPAIRRKFVVIKRLEEEMGAFVMDPEVVQKDDAGMVLDWLQKAVEGDDAPKEALAKVIELLGEIEKVEPKKPEEEDTEKAVPADLKSAITDVVAWMKKMAKGPGAPTDEIGRVATFLGKVAGGKYPKSADKVEPKEEDKDKYPMAKGEDDVLVVVKADGSMEINPNVTKGRKAFTAERTDAMKSALIQLASVLGEADGEALKAVMTALKDLPEGTVPDSQVRPVAPTQKSETDEAVIKALDAIQKRLDAIEKTRAPSQGGDAVVTEEPVEKNAGFWGGQILS